MALGSGCLVFAALLRLLRWPVIYFDALACAGAAV